MSVRPSVLAAILRGAAAGGGSYSTEAQAYFAAMSSQPTTARKALIDALIVGLKADGVWPKLGALYLLAAHDAQAARLNVVSPSGTALSAVNTPTFTVDRGYTGDGASSHLATGVIYSSFPQMSLNSQHFGLGGDYSTAAGWAVGVVETGTYIGFNNVVPATIRLGCNASATINVNLLARLIFNRTSSASILSFENGGNKQSANVSSELLKDHQIALLRTGVIFCNARLSYAHFGAGLSDIEAASFDTRISTYLTAIGA